MTLSRGTRTSPSKTTTITMHHHHHHHHNANVPYRRFRELLFCCALAIIGMMFGSMSIQESSKKNFQHLPPQTPTRLEVNDSPLRSNRNSIKKTSTLSSSTSSSSSPDMPKEKVKVQSPSASPPLPSVPRQKEQVSPPASKREGKASSPPPPLRESSSSSSSKRKEDSASPTSLPPSSSSSSSKSKQKKASQAVKVLTPTPSLPLLVKENNNTEPLGPKVVWLMSFPNSGTSFTGQLIQHLTQSRSATNYGKGNYDGTGWSVPIHTSLDGTPDYDGPFFVDPSKRNYKPEVDEYILTKTHCGGYCQFCHPNSYKMNITRFEDSCISTDRVWVDDDGEKVYEKSKYPTTKVKKAIHLIRDPFDNIVSRFHLEIHEERKRIEKTNSNAEAWENSRDGFRKFCQAYAKKYAPKERRNQVWDKQPGLEKLKEEIPCSTDFFRWIQWHNHANELTAQMDVPTYVLNYENFGTRFNQTLDEILDFLSMTPKGKPHTFIRGKAYKEYFHSNELKKVRQVMKILATEETWAHVKHYFD